MSDTTLPKENALAFVVDKLAGGDHHQVIDPADTKNSEAKQPEYS